MSDLLQSLLPLTWRGIAFPHTGLSTEFSQDLASHKTPDVDGERFEATGRSAYSLTGHIPFINTILPGPNETWEAGTLYPKVHRQFLRACADRSTGDLVHPSLGTLRCKVRSYKSTLSATSRGGEDVDVTWVVTNEDDGDDSLTGPSPLSDALATAIVLDRYVVTLGLGGGGGGFGFADLVNSIQAVTDTAGLVAMQYSARINRTFAQLDRLQSSLSRLQGVTKSLAVQHATRLENTLHKVQSTLLVTKTVTTYVVARTTTLAALTGQLGTTIGDLIKLNPALVRLPNVPEGTTVRYHKAA